MHVAKETVVGTVKVIEKETHGWNSVYTLDYLKASITIPPSGETVENLCEK